MTKKVLIMDDNIDITEMVSKYLTVKGVECVTVNDGKSGVDLMKKEKFDTVILDMSMPEISGFDVILTLEKEDVLKNQRIIIFTALSSSDDAIKEMIKKEGVKKCLKKPVILSEILEAVNE